MERLAKDTVAVYKDFNSLRKAFGLPKINKQTRDKTKLAKQRENFAGKHVCRGCGKPMTMDLNTNIMVCTNPGCKGIKRTKLDSEGNEKVYFTPSYFLLNEKGAEIGNNIFAKDCPK
jgi:hypothetical protein